MCRALEAPLRRSLLVALDQEVRPVVRVVNPEPVELLRGGIERQHRRDPAHPATEQQRRHVRVHEHHVDAAVSPLSTDGTARAETRSGGPVRVAGNTRRPLRHVVRHEDERRVDQWVTGKDRLQVLAIGDMAERLLDDERGVQTTPRGPVGSRFRHQVVQALRVLGRTNWYRLLARRADHTSRSKRLASLFIASVRLAHARSSRRARCAVALPASGACGHRRATAEPDR